MKRCICLLVLCCMYFSSSAQNEATWIWYPGDYEIWLGNQVQNRRTERGAFFPPFWRIYSHYVQVDFQKEYEISEPEDIEIHTEGEYNVKIDSKMLEGKPARLTLPAGKHTINIKVYNQATVPSVFVDGRNVVSDKSWKVTFEDKEWIDESGKVSDKSATDWLAVGSWDFNDAQSRPSAFRLPTEPKKAENIERSGNTLLVDFGQETFGFVKFHGLKGNGKLNLYYGESKEEALSTEHCETFDLMEVGPTMQGEFILLGSRAFRYVQVQHDPSVAFDSVSMLYEYLPLDYRGSFRSSDARLNEIWDISAYTMHLTSREFFIDGIKRDRWMWSGDAYQSYLMNYYLFFDSPSVTRTMIALRGKEPVSSHINTIMDYSFYWFVGIYDYYLYTGDQEFIKQFYPRMVSLMDFCLNRRNEEGMVQGLTGDWVFIDWADGLSKQGEVSFEQLLFARSLEAMAISAEIAGDTEGAERYSQLAKELKEKLFNVFWSDEKQALLHNRVDGELQDNVTRYANMFAIFFDYLDEEQKQGVKNNVLLNDNVQKITTPYMRFYELEALCAMGEQEFVLDEIRDYWGGMLDLGATSFWEKYDPSEEGVEHFEMYGRPFGKSLCHAWGASPVYLFGKYYLGVKPLSPAYATYSIEPELGGLEWMEGKVPTPNGDIEVYCSTKQIKVKAENGDGTLRFRSSRKPSSRGVSIRKLDQNLYEMDIQPGKEYSISYRAVE